MSKKIENDIQWMRFIWSAKFFFLRQKQMSHNVRKHTFGHVRPGKIQISLRIRTVLSVSSVDAFWIAKDGKFLQAQN